MDDQPEPQTYLDVTCFAAPTQIEGTAPTGEHIYFRYRWGTATLDINGTTVWSEKYGHAESSVMDTEDAFRLIGTFLAFHTAHNTLRVKLPLGPVPPLPADAQALMDRWTSTTPSA